jgi:hypothetical protein
VKKRYIFAILAVAAFFIMLDGILNWGSPGFSLTYFYAGS